ncbi:deaminase [Salegentibacter mishustinae]|nr:deaminase [Salegentibacter mishustinae]PZX60633.1 diaminohydroxyphosphoribosylaminopyrimidine deaminase [Salegentibacter mishustinae]
MKISVEEHLKCTEFPRVGAVIEKDGAILSTGFRGEYDKMHAERVAIEKLTPEELENSTLYTTLEPCVSVKEDQKIESCADLIIRSRIKETVIGVLDPNGTIYTQGYRKLLENNISVAFFNRKLREAVEEETFEFGELHSITGPGKRRIPIVHSGTSLTVQFSENDKRSFQIRWTTLQPIYGFVDLISTNGAVRVASGATEFMEITDPLVFRFPSHFARMKKGMIAIVCPVGATFCLLVKLIEVYKNDIQFQWEMRNLN